MATKSICKYVPILCLCTAITYSCDRVPDADLETVYFREKAEENIKAEILQLLQDIKFDPYTLYGYSPKGTELGDSVHRVAQEAIQKVPRQGKMPDLSSRKKTVDALLDKSGFRPYEKMQLRTTIWYNTDEQSSTNDRQTIIYQYLYTELLILRKLHERYAVPIQYEDIYHVASNNKIVVRFNTPEDYIFPQTDSIVVAGCVFDGVVLSNTAVELIADKEICVGIIQLPEALGGTSSGNLTLLINIINKNRYAHAVCSYIFIPAKYDYSTGNLIK